MRTPLEDSRWDGRQRGEPQQGSDGMTVKWLRGLPETAAERFAINQRALLLPEMIGS